MVAEQPILDQLTPRHRQVVVLVGRKGLSYKAAAATLRNQHRDGEKLSAHTVRAYAREIRDMIDPALSPRSALVELYWTHPKDFEEVAA